MNKAKATEAINDMPTDFELDVLIEKLILIEKVEKGLDQLNVGNTFTHEQVKQKVREWQK
ncbi:hypothetical protein [uncultured Mucilaginibacter sp.]|uniref:hypothetical protein n=1 Tax=uncultured Mucilaginibacter sp. TaxID=797541 RepID=UPI0025EA79A4|nr:hypothetical protein [uncultured Mucilaginibacter sp.]